MVRDDQIEPCVALHLSDDGVELTVAARLRQGALTWTPEEAGEWFARNWQEAQQALFVCTVHRFMVEPNGQLIRQGEMSWSVENRPDDQSGGLASGPQPAAEVPSAASDTAPEDHAYHLPDLVRVPESGFTEREPNPDLSEAEDALRRVLQVLVSNGRPVNIPDLRRLTGLSDYRVRRALRELQSANRITEELREVGAGRWKDQSFYSVKGD